MISRYDQGILNNMVDHIEALNILSRSARSLGLEQLGENLHAIANGLSDNVESLKKRAK